MIKKYKFFVKNNYSPIFVTFLRLTILSFLLLLLLNKMANYFIENIINFNTIFIITVIAFIFYVLFSDLRTRPSGLFIGGIILILALIIILNNNTNEAIALIATILFILICLLSFSVLKNKKTGL